MPRIKDQPLCIEYRSITSLIPYARNARTHSAEQVAQIAASIREFGWTTPVLVDGTNGVIAGHGRILAAQKLGIDRVPCIELAHLSEAQRRAYIIADNKLALNAGWDEGLLRLELGELRGGGFDLALTGFDQVELANVFGALPDRGNGNGNGSLAEEFGVPPFSVLNAREGWWQARKQAWLGLGIQSELGRGDATPGGRGDGSAWYGKAAPGGSAMPAASLVNGHTVRGDGRGRRANAAPDGAALNEAMAANRQSPMGYPSGRKASLLGGTAIDGSWVGRVKGAEYTGLAAGSSGTSIFDPVLSELVYRWFCPPGGMVLDPFAGGSVRGIVAACLDRRYWGVDLRPEQIAANEEQAGAILVRGLGEYPEWHCGDARQLANLSPPLADLVFTCPPYGDLERYSNDQADLSTMQYPEFIAGLETALTAALAQLRDERFAAILVGDFRDNAGHYRGFIADTQAIFRRAGLALYNEAVLVTAIGSLPIRVRKQFQSSRKLGKTHQNLLVFVKGDPLRATEAIGLVEFGSFDVDGQPFGGDSIDHRPATVVVGHA